MTTPLTDTQVAEALVRVRAYVNGTGRYVDSAWMLADLRTLLALADEADARKDAL